MFGYDHREIGEVLDRSVDPCRSSPTARGALQELLEVLSPDVTLTADAGGRVRAPRVPIRTADKVGRVIAARADAIPEGTTIEYVDVNARPGAVAVLDGMPYAVFSVEVDPGTRLVTHVRLIANPDKLSALVGQWSARCDT